jgi:TolB protein
VQTAQPEISFLRDNQLWVMNADGYVVNADGSAKRNLPRIIPVSGGAWSPDGRKIAFVRASERVGTPRANRDVYVVNTDGSGLRRLTTHPEYDGDPAWSDDGRRIAFLSQRDGRSEIYVMNADGSRERRLTRSLADEGWLAWSPARR